MLQRTPIPALLTAAALATVGGCAPQAGDTLASKPNIVLVMTDDQGWAQVGFHGNPYIRTPTLDRLASESTEFTQFYVEPKCAPTRAALLTGRHGYRSGVVDTYLGRTLMRSEAVTLAELLADAGYATGIFGKWHLGDNYPLRPGDQGFQETLVHRGGGLGQPAGPPGNTYWDPILEHNGESRRFEGYCTGIFTDALIAFLRENRDRPFFGYLATNVPHGPFDIDEEWIEPYREMGLPERTARVYGMIEEFDQNLDRLLRELDALELADRTIVIFLTDNGPTQQTFTAGLRERKGSAYEGGTRVPFLFRWQGRVEPGRKIDRIAAHIDLVPTLLDAAGITVSSAPSFDGVSLWPLLSGAMPAEEWPERTIYLQNHRGDTPQLNRNASARSQRWKLVQPLGKASDPMPPDAKFELYDMSQDPGETSDLAERHPEIAARMRRDYEEWFEDVSAGGFEPGLIHLGSEVEPATTLSRFDWRGEYDERAAEDSLGYWPVVIDRPGSYDIALRFAGPLPEAGAAHLSVGGTRIARAVAAGHTAARFEGIDLEAGRTRLEGRVEFGGLVRGPSFVDVSRLD